MCFGGSKSSGPPPEQKTDAPVKQAPAGSEQERQPTAARYTPGRIQGPKKTATLLTEGGL